MAGTANGCPSCGKGVGVQHSGSCEGARCLQTGLKRLECKRYSPTHCGRDRWEGQVHGLLAHGREWDSTEHVWYVPPPPPHPNAGECVSSLKGHLCLNEAPKYGDGFDERGASPLCFECQDLLAAWKTEQRAMQKGQKA